MQTSNKENFKNDSESSDKWDELVGVIKTNKENLKNNSISSEEKRDNNLKSSSDSPENETVSKKEKKSNFYENHPEKLTEIITCAECGLSYRYTCKSRHYKSQKHILIVTTRELEKLKKQKKNTQCC